MTIDEFESCYVNRVYCSDCLPIMLNWPDDCCDLLLVDPPYGIGMAAKGGVRGKHAPSNWDACIPDKKVFSAMQRVSREQIIWGGNYFTEYLKPSKCFLVWNKLQPENITLGMCEYAWTSFDKPAQLFTQSVHKEGNAYHPTQKPLNLMLWCLAKYSKPNDLVFDAYMGSGSTLVAAKMLGRRYIGIDISQEYCKIARQRLEATETGVPVKEQNAGQMALFPIGAVT